MSEAKGGGGLAAATWVWGVILWGAATLALGALVVDALGTSSVVAAPGASVLARGVAWLGSLALTLAVPALVARKLRGESSQEARGVFRGSLAFFNLLWLAGLIGLLPGQLRASLEREGDWFLMGAEAPAIQGGLREVATWIPRSGAAAAAGRDAGHESESESESEGERAEGAAAPAGNESPADDEGQLHETALAEPEVTPADTEGAPAPAGALSGGEIFRQHAASVVQIQARAPFDTENDPLAELLQEMGETEHQRAGSGFLVGSGGLVVTNHHVLGDATSARVSLQDGRTFDDVQVLATDAANDLVLIRIAAQDLPAVELAPVEAPAVGDEVFAIGSPLGFDYSLTQGIVSSVRDYGGTRTVQMQAPIAPGSSGGPLFNAAGQVVGVNTATHAAGLNFAVHHQYLRALLEANAANTEGEFQELDTFVLGPHAEDFEIEGATLIPTLRVQLDSVVKAYALVVARCTDVLPDAATLTVQIPRLRQLGGDAELSGNLDAPTLRCVRRRGRMLQSLVALLLGQIPSEDELRISARVVDVGGAPDTRDVANEGAESIEGASGERSLRVTLVRAAP